MYRDEYDLQLTCASDAALQAYLSGIECSLRLDRPAIDEFSEAIVQDEEFALAHAALGQQLSIHGFRNDSAIQFELALSLKDRVTQREQRAIDVAAAAARSDPDALTMAMSHAATYPQDVFVLAHLLGPFGLLAFSGTHDWCAQNVALLEATRQSFRADDWWHVTTRGFFGAEQGQLAQARRDCERAWSICENGNCAHSMAHLHFEAGALDEGRTFIDDWAAKYGAKSDMRHHMMWHFSLLDLESGVDMRQVAEMYDRELDPGVNDPTPLETLTDNASFLWRCHLSAVEIPLNTREELLQYAENNFPECGFAFADIHRAMATALHPENEKHADLMDQLSAFSSRTGTQEAECVRQYAAGFGAFANRAYDDVVRLLGPLLADSVLIGGSNPQRRIIEETYVEACMRAGQYDKASEIVQGRKRDFSVFDSDLLKKINGRSN